MRLRDACTDPVALPALRRALLGGRARDVARDLFGALQEHLGGRTRAVPGRVVGACAASVPSRRRSIAYSRKS